MRQSCKCQLLITKTVITNCHHHASRYINQAGTSTKQVHQPSRYIIQAGTSNMYMCLILHHLCDNINPKGS